MSHHKVGAGLLLLIVVDCPQGKTCGFVATLY
jgi:hypothetical protein